MRHPRPRKASRSNRFTPCSRCFHGLQLIETVRDGKREREGRRCQCLRQWLETQKAPAIPPPERPRAGPD